MVSEAWYREHAGPVLLFIQRLGFSSGDAEDLAHDTFLVAHERWRDFDQRRAARPWLFGIAARLASARRQRFFKTREVPFTGQGDVAEEKALPDMVVEQKRRRERLARAVDELSDELRVVFVLHDLEGTSMPEVALALEVPLNTGYSRLRAARLAVAQAFERHAPERS